MVKLLKLLIGVEIYEKIFNIKKHKNRMEIYHAQGRILFIR